MRRPLGLAVTLALAFVLVLPAQERPTFRAQTQIVLVPFHVERDKYYVSDVKPSDIVLLEDRRPRDFSTFEGPSTANRPGLELVLVFDVNLPGASLWNPDYEFMFAKSWDENLSRRVLERGKENVRISVYRFSPGRMQRLAKSTTDPREFLSAFQHLLSPMAEADTVPVTPPADWKAAPGRRESGGFRNATIDAIQDSTAVPDHLLLTVVLFSRGWGASASAEDVAAAAVEHAIPITPVVMSMDVRGLRRPDDNGTLKEIPDGRPFVDMVGMRKLSDLTGGRFFNHASIDNDQLRDILESVKNEGLSQYVIGFAPPAQSGTPRTHKLEIRPVSKSHGELTGGIRTATY